MCSDWSKFIKSSCYKPLSQLNCDFAGMLVYDHPMNISAKFGSNLFCGFRKKDENVKFP
jgi:hypothetical protein